MIVRRTLRDDAWKILAYAALLAANLVVTIVAFPTFEANYQLVANLVPDFLGVVKKALLSAAHDKFAAFLGINHFFKGANVVGTAAAILLALGTVVREVETGTLPLLLSRPVTRRRILLDWALVHVLGLVLPLLLLSAAVPELARFFLDRDVSRWIVVRAAFQGSAFLVLAYGISLLVAVLLPEQIQVAGAAGGLFVLSFLLYFVDSTRPFTLYNLSSMEIHLDLARGGPFPWGAFAACLGGGLAAVAAAAWTFERRDY